MNLGTSDENAYVIKHDFILSSGCNNSILKRIRYFKAKHTCFCRVNSEALIPESTDKNVAIICRDHETMCIDLDTLINEVRDLPLVHTRVIG